MRRSFGRAAALAGLIAAAALAGCAGAVRVSEQSHGLANLHANRNYLQYAGQRTPVLMRVRGAPVEPARVAAMADGAVPGVPVRFTVEPAAAAQPHFHVVLVFDAPQGMTGRQACAPQGEVPRATGEGSRLFGVFCDRAEPLADAYGSGPTLTGPDDPNLITLVRSTVAGIFPRPEPDWDRRGDFWVGTGIGIGF